MKQFFRSLILLCLTALLAGCSRAEAPKPTVSAPTPTESVRTTVGQFCAGADFDALNQKIDNGADLPHEADCYLGGGSMVTVSDPDAIAQLWQAACAVEIESSTVQAPDILDGDIGFLFRWTGGREYAFDFLTYEFFYRDGNYYPVCKRGQVGKLCDMARDSAQSECTEPSLSQPEVTTNTLRWDFDGDDTPETILLDIQDNGDEAANVLTLTWEDQEICLDGVYSVETAEASEPGCLVITCRCGDFYSHDTLNSFRLSFTGGKLTVQAQ